MEAAWRTRLAGLGVAARIHPWRTAVALVWLLVIVVCALGLAIWLVGTTLALLGSLALLAGVVAVAWGSNRGDPGPTGGLHRVLHGLETPRLALRRPVPADAPAIFATVDAEVIRANGWTEDGIRSLRLAIMHPRLVESAAGTLLTDRASGAVIGALEIYGWDRERRTCCVEKGG